MEIVSNFPKYVWPRDKSCNSQEIGESYDRQHSAGTQHINGYEEGEFIPRVIEKLTRFTIGGHKYIVG